MLDLTQAEFHVRGTDLGGVLARAAQHLVRHVNADHPAPGAHLRGREQTVEAGAAAQIDHGLAGLQGGDGLRIAAAKAEIGALRHGGEVLRRIAHPRGLADCIGGRRRAAAGGRRGRTAGRGLHRRAAIRHRAGRDAAVAGANHFLDLGLVHARVLSRSRSLGAQSTRSSNEWQPSRPVSSSARSGPAPPRFPRIRTPAPEPLRHHGRARVVRRFGF